MAVHRSATVAAALAALTVLSACADRGEGSNRGLLERAGLSRGGPDEFLVIERRPLETPPELTALPPPQPGAQSRVDPRPDEALARIFGGVEPSAVVAEPSVGQTALFERMGGNSTAGGRELITAEHEQRRRRASRELWALIFGDPLIDPYRGDRLIPQNEIERLREAYPNLTLPSVPAEIAGG
ncbi:MAG: DUF3035 domain-containing protein [Pseudomonadota bacterium]